MEIAIIIALILLNGVFAMSEIALISARKSSLSNDIRHGSSTARIALKLANDPDKFLSTIQIGITLIGILTGIYSGDVLATDFGNILTDAGVPATYAYLLAQTLIVILVTYLTIIFGELVPKRIGMSASTRAAKLLARPMYWLSVIASPFVWILAKSTSLIFNLLHINTAEEKVTEEEIKSMIDEGTENGEVQEVEQDIVDLVIILPCSLRCKFLPQTNRHSILILCAPHFNVAVKLTALLVKRRIQLRRFVFQLHKVPNHRNLTRRRNNIVRRLSLIHVIIRMHRIIASQFTP